MKKTIKAWAAHQPDTKEIQSAFSINNMMESIPEGSQGKVWYVVDEKTQKELAIASTLTELIKKYSKKDVIYGSRWYFPKVDKLISPRKDIV